jgi:hypothetical protein
MSTQECQSKSISLDDDDVVTVVRFLQVVYYGGCTLYWRPDYVDIDEESMLRSALRHQVGATLPPDILAKTWRSIRDGSDPYLDARVQLYAFAEKYQVPQIQKDVLSLFDSLYNDGVPGILTLCDKLNEKCPMQEEWKKKIDDILCSRSMKQQIQFYKDDDRLWDWIHKRELAKQLFYYRL